MKPVPQIIAVGGGKGGVGKSMVAAGLATAFAQAGQATTIVDLDLGGANLHTIFGMRTTAYGIGDYLYGADIKTLDRCAVETGVPHLKLISGNGFIPGIANLEHQKKIKVLKALARLEADYVVLDLGAGTSYNVIDFFSITQSGIVVSVPEPTAILNAYEFLKNVVYRVFSRRFGPRTVAGDIVKSFKNAEDGAAKSEMAALIAAVRARDPAAADAMKAICRAFRPGLILNMSRGHNATLAKSLGEICGTYLDVALTFLGAIPQDDHVRRAVYDMKPFLIDFPEAPCALALRAIARKCRERTWVQPDFSGRLDAAAVSDEDALVSAAPASIPPTSTLLQGRRDIELSSLVSHFFAAAGMELAGREALAGGSSVGVSPLPVSDGAVALHAEGPVSAPVPATTAGETARAGFTLSTTFGQRIAVRRFSSAPPPEDETDALPASAPVSLAPPAPAMAPPIVPPPASAEAAVSAVAVAEAEPEGAVPASSPEPPPDDVAAAAEEELKPSVPSVAPTSDEPATALVLDLPIEPRLEARLRMPRFVTMEPPQAEERGLLERWRAMSASVAGGDDAGARAVAQILQTAELENETLALLALNARLPKTPETGAAWMTVGLKNVERGRMTLAQTAFANAQLCLPDHPAVTCNRAASMIAVGMLETAHATLAAGVRRHAEDRALRFNLGLVLMAMGRHAQAADQFAVVSREEREAVAFLEAFCHFKAGRFLRAETLFAALAEADPRNGHARFNRALAQLRAGDGAAAVASFTQVITFAPEDTEALAGLALAQWQTQQSAETVATLTRAVRLKPADLTLRTARGMLCARLGVYDLAIEDIQIITDLVPANQTFRLLLADIRRRLAG